MKSCVWPLSLRKPWCISTEKRPRGARMATSSKAHTASSAAAPPASVSASSCSLSIFEGKSPSSGPLYSTLEGGTWKAISTRVSSASLAAVSSTWGVGLLGGW